MPLTALVLASGMIQDEVEEQTLTYLLIRPLPRPVDLRGEAAGDPGASPAALAAVFTTLTFVAVYWGADDFGVATIPGRAARVRLASSALSLLVYVALFGCLGLVVRWVLAARGGLHRPVRGGLRQHRLRRPQADGALVRPRPGRALARPG